MALISAADLSRIKEDIRGIVQDSSIGAVTVKYRMYSGVSPYYDIESQSMKEGESPYTDYSSVSAIMGTVTKKDIESIKGISFGDTRFLIMQSHVTGTVSTQDLIVYSGTTYSIINFGKDPIGLVYPIFGRSS